MEYNVTEVSPVETSINVKVPAEEVNAAMAATIAIYRQRTDMPGFRKGKVPSSLVEAKFRKQIMHEAANDLLNVHINDIMNELKHMAISRLDVSEVELERDKPIEYTVTFEHAPKFDLPEYKGLAVEEEEALASDEEVSSVVERIRNNLADFKVLSEDRLPVDGDSVVVSFSATENGEPVPGVKAENFQLSLGENQALPDFEALVKTILPGRDATGKVSFPADFINQGLAGKTVDMNVTLHVIKERQLPDLNDEMAKRAGNFDSLAHMREVIAKSYATSRQQLYRAAAQKKLLDELLAKMDFALPPSMVTEQTAHLVNEFKDKLERQGKSPEALGKSDEELVKEMEPKAKEMVKAQIFLLTLADKEGIETTPQEIDGFFNQMAARTGQDVLTLKQYYEHNNLVIPVRDKILADKAMEHLYNQAQVTKVPAKKAEETPQA
ncbi:trigger factor [Fundidesulfovibrio butyratiphilus]